MELFTRGKTWWVRFTFNGQQYRRSTGKKKKLEAQSVAAAIVLQVEGGDETTRTPPTLKEFAEGWFAEWIAESRKIKPRTKESYAYGAALIAKQPFYRKRMDHITAEDAEMMSIPGSASTFNCATRTLRRMFRLALRQGFIRSAPEFKTLAESGRVEVITAQDEIALEAILSSRSVGHERGIIRAALPLRSDLKMMPNEISQLRISDIDFEAGTVRNMVMTDEVKTALKKACSGRTEGWVFPSSNLPGRPIGRQAITKALKRYRQCRSRGSALKVAFPVHMDTGLRPEEMVHLRIEDVDFTRGEILVTHSKSQAGIRRVPMTDRVRKILFAHISSRTEGWLFPSPRYQGRPITRPALTQAFRLARTMAGLPKSKKLYSARHTFGTDLMAGTGNPKLVMDLMGHSDLKVTMHYLHPETSKVAAIMNERNQTREAEVFNKKPTN
jgi:integrase